MIPFEDRGKKIKEIRRCAITALLPLMNEEEAAADGLLQLQLQQIHRYETIAQLKDILAENHLPDDLRRKFTEDLRILDSADKPLETLENVIMDLEGVPEISSMAKELALGFALVISSTDAITDADKIGYEGKIKTIHDRVLAQKRRVPDMQKEVEDAVKWLDAAAMIANSNKLLHAENAFHHARNQR